MCSKLPFLLLASCFTACLSLSVEPWMDLWKDPTARATALLNNMTLAEKIHLLHGSGSGYVGNVAAQRNGAIPALTLNDGPQVILMRCPRKSTSL
jgi:hypothetical protein